MCHADNENGEKERNNGKNRAIKSGKTLEHLEKKRNY